MRKKILTMLVMVIFILSVLPAVLAEDGKDSGDVPELYNEKVGKGKEDGKGPVLEAAKEKVEFAKEKLEQAKERYQDAKEKYSAARERYQDQKEDLEKAKERIKSCDDDDESDDSCVNVKKDLKVGVKNHLEKITELIQRSLERLESQITDSKVMTDADKEEAYAKLSESKVKLETLLAEIQLLSENSTPTELREKIKELKNLWNEVSKEERWLITQLINHKMDNLVEKHNEFHNAMQMRYQYLEEKGANAEDLADLQEIIDQFKEEVDELNELQVHADAAWKQAKSDSKEMEAAKEAQTQVRKQMTVTKEVLKKFTAKYKEIQQDLGLIKNSDDSSEEDNSEEVGEDNSSNQTEEST